MVPFGQLPPARQVRRPLRPAGGPHPAQATRPSGGSDVLGHLSCGGHSGTPLAPRAGRLPACARTALHAEANPEHPAHASAHSIRLIKIHKANGLWLPRERWVGPSATKGWPPECSSEPRHTQEGRAAMTPGRTGLGLWREAIPDLSFTYFRNFFQP